MTSSNLRSCSTFWRSQCCTPKSFSPINSESDQVSTDSSKHSYPRILTNILAPITFLASGALLYTQYFNITSKNPAILTACYIGMGASTRFLLDANLPENTTKIIHKITSKAFFETYEFLWQATINVSNLANYVSVTPIQEALLDTISFVGSFSTIGDWLFPFKSYNKSIANQTIEDLQLDKPSVNPIIGPSFSNFKGQLLLKAAMAAAGIGLTVLSYSQKSSLNTLYRSLGFFLTFQSPGFFLGQGWAKLWKISEDKDFVRNRLEDFTEEEEVSLPRSDIENGGEDESSHGTSDDESPDFSERSSENSLRDLSQLKNIDLSSLGNTQVITPTPSWTTRIFRLSSGIITAMGSEILAAVYLINTPYLYIPAGLVYGGVQYFAQRKFQVMTKDVYQAQIENNLWKTPYGKNVKRALLIEMIASSFFLAPFFGWFSYGAADENSAQDRWSLLVLMISYLTTGLIALPTETLFKPEQKGVLARFVNHLRFIGYNHSLLLSISAFSLFQISEINDEALKLDDKSQYICGLIAMACFGSTFALHRLRNISLSGKDGVSPSIVRMIFFKTMIFRFMNKFGV